MSQINYYRVRDIKRDVDELWEKGLCKGLMTGINSLDEYYTVKPGCTTYIMGSPYSGKTELLFELLINLSENYGYKHVIFSPETGYKEHIVAELISKYCKKWFYGTHRPDQDEKDMAIAWLDEHFYIIDSNASLSIPRFYDLIDRIEDEQGVKIHTTSGDPFNEFTHDFTKDSNRQDLYIERMLGIVRKNAAVKDRHNFILTHCRDQAPITSDGITYYPPPTARDYAGGQAWFRKGLAMLCVWRPPYGLCDKDGRPYKENETHVIIQKSKPKGIGKTGKVIIYYDLNKQRYYEEEANDLPF